MKQFEMCIINGARRQFDVYVVKKGKGKLSETQLNL